MQAGGSPSGPQAAAGGSAEYDPWAGQHVPSQGFTPHLNPLPTPADPYLDPRDQAAETMPLGDPGNPYQPFPAAAAAYTASSAAAPAAPLFPLAMSSPFAQAGYPATSDPWATHPPNPSTPPHAESGFPSPSQHQNPWADSTSHLAVNPWNPMAAAGSPWDTARGGDTPAAVLVGDHGGLSEGYRSPDGRPAVALLVLGFAGKAYCWRPTATPGEPTCTSAVHVHQSQLNAVSISQLNPVNACSWSACTAAFHVRSGQRCACRHKQRHGFWVDVH